MHKYCHIILFAIYFLKSEQKKKKKKKKLESAYIQLPYSYVPDQNPNEKLHFDLPLNYKKSLLFDKLPYVVQLNNPAIDDVVQGKKNDELSIQKFLLATDLLQDTIQDNLDMIVTDGDFNDASVRRVLDTKFPSVMKTPTATNFIFRDKAKFDIQTLFLEPYTISSY